MGHRMDFIRLLLHELPKGKSAPREALGHQAAPKVQTGPGPMYDQHFGAWLFAYRMIAEKNGVLALALLVSCRRNKPRQ